MLHLFAPCVGGRAGVWGAVCVSWQVARQNACISEDTDVEPHLERLQNTIPCTARVDKMQPILLSFKTICASSASSVIVREVTSTAESVKACRLYTQALS
jgi:hypothetical protein